MVLLLPNPPLDRGIGCNVLPPVPELISTRLIVHFKHESPRRHEDAQRGTDREAGLMEPAPLKPEKRNAL
jgi:hypothetical protein